MKEVRISTDIREMDIDLVHDYLSKQSYWAKGRGKEEVVKSMENSICFAVFDGNAQIGFARLVTDYVVFAWLMDVFVIDEYKNKGVGRFLMDYIMNLPEIKEVNGFGLRTRDAHGFYIKYGFHQISEPETWMQKIR
ncbi:GNAT family N-acetyltransferase [uncultured Eudoraea sp.]|jgi:GNAT superfamily N-acetyltransferase|uniref:GNAT family N-acetyltransferase n=1 Tax=uncultured Eudoraea sp. TaxID=1035614 RepID=UPI00261431ED|nr:GNAT family N-acetyltransferase [uncultured Eudoraea sp.]